MVATLQAYKTPSTSAEAMLGEKPSQAPLPAWQQGEGCSPIASPLPHIHICGGLIGTLISCVKIKHVNLIQFKAE